MHNTVDGSPRSDEAHQGSVRMPQLRIHEDIKIDCDNPIETSCTSIERYRKN